MEFIQGWVRGLVALAVMVGFVELMLPQDGFKPYVRMILGLLVVVALVRPVIQKLPEWKQMELTLADHNQPVENVMVLGERIQKRGAEAASELLPPERQLEAVIKQRVPNIEDLSIFRLADGRYRLMILSSGGEVTKTKVWRELKTMGWEEDRVEVIVNGR